MKNKKISHEQKKYNTIMAFNEYVLRKKNSGYVLKYILKVEISI